MKSELSNLYQMDRPREQEAVGSLVKIFGPRKAAEVWAQACEAQGFHQPRAELSPPELMSVAEQLCREASLVGLVGQSLRIRLMVYDQVTRHHPAAPYEN
ncbi:MAG: hypothetical protein Q7P63_02500 [Verrucomicrobiota bacterium JB022]|nr:hypothetical protein [Verrucomicrobiota bacterium JB022]